MVAFLGAAVCWAVVGDMLRAASTLGPSPLSTETEHGKPNITSEPHPAAQNKAKGHIFHILL